MVPCVVLQVYVLHYRSKSHPLGVVGKNELHSLEPANERMCRHACVATEAVLLCHCDINAGSAN